MPAPTATADPTALDPTALDPTDRSGVEPLLVASVDELRVLASLRGAVLPPVLDGDLDGEARTAADVAAVRSLLARGWLVADEDGTAGAAPAVARALGALVDPEVILEVEVLVDGDLRRLAVVGGAAGDRWVEEKLLGVWSLAPRPSDLLARLDARLLADDAGPGAGGPDAGTTADAAAATEPDGRPGVVRDALDVDAELARGGREVVLRLARRRGADRYEAHELHWLTGPSGRWVLEPDDGEVDPDGDDGRVPVDRAVPVDADELDATLVEFLATVADAVAR